MKEEGRKKSEDWDGAEEEGEEEEEEEEEKEEEEEELVGSHMMKPLPLTITCSEWWKRQRSEDI